MSVIGDRIRQLMKERHMTQNSLARAAQLSQSGLSSIINGAVSPKEETVRAIAKALCVPPAFLMEEDAAATVVAQAEGFQPRQEGADILNELPEDAYRAALAMLHGLAREYGLWGK